MSAAYADVREYLLTRCTERGKGGSQKELAELVTLWRVMPVDFQLYLSEFGWAICGPHRLMGLGPDVPGEQDILERSAELWRGDGAYRLPRDLLPFYDSGGGWFYCLRGDRSEQTVVCWAQEYDELGEPQPYDETYASWSDWFGFHVISSR